MSNSWKNIRFVGEQMIKNVANIITSFRILGSILLLFFPVFSEAFYSIYLLCGFSDMIDGAVARRTNSSSRFGAKFDSVADFVFVVVVCCRLLPVIHLPQWLWIWITVIAVVKTSNIIWGELRMHSLISIHSALNKVTGFVLFLLPLTIQFVELKHSFAAVCLIATIAAIQEGYFVRSGREII